MRTGMSKFAAMGILIIYLGGIANTFLFNVFHGFVHFVYQEDAAHQHSSNLAHIHDAFGNHVNESFNEFNEVNESSGHSHGVLMDLLMQQEKSSPDNSQHQSGNNIKNFDKHFKKDIISKALITINSELIKPVQLINNYKSLNVLPAFPPPKLIS